MGKAMYTHQGPVLSVCWSKVRNLEFKSARFSPFAQDGTKVFSGGADNTARMYDIATGQATQVAQHDAPVSCVGWVDVPGQGILATGSWDKTIKVRRRVFIDIPFLNF